MAIFRQKILQFLATFPPNRKSFGLFFAQITKIWAIPLPNSDFGIFWLLLGTPSGSSGLKLLWQHIQWGLTHHKPMQYAIIMPCPDSFVRMIGYILPTFMSNLSRVIILNVEGRKEDELFRDWLPPMGAVLFGRFSFREGWHIIIIEYSLINLGLLFSNVLNTNVMSIIPRT